MTAQTCDQIINLANVEMKVGLSSAVRDEILAVSPYTGRSKVPLVYCGATTSSSVRKYVYQCGLMHALGLTPTPLSLACVYACTAGPSMTARVDAHRECTALIEGGGAWGGVLPHVKYRHHVGQSIAIASSPLRREGVHDAGLQGAVGHKHALCMVFSCRVVLRGRPL